MAKIDDLVAEVADEKLRGRLTDAVNQLRRNKKFGLVFEEHIPETTLLAAGVGIRVGAEVVVRTETDNVRYVVTGIEGDDVQIALDDEQRTLAKHDLMVAKPFGEAVYPVFRQFGDPVIRSEDKPFHTVINGENFHALQLLLFGYEGQVDCIYIDPPYNTGARDWTYNNDYVDENATWRHSKWLSMMERRLLLAKKLLKPDGVLVVTIDEHEVGNLHVLLAQNHLFAGARRQMVTIVNNAAGVTQGGFSRVEEYAIFCFLGSARPIPVADDLLSDETKTKKATLWFSMIRYGGINALPSKRPNLVYPIVVDPNTNRILATGKSLKDLADEGKVMGSLDDWRPKMKAAEKAVTLWPYRSDGSLSTWQLNAKSLVDLAAQGFVRIRPQSNGPGGNQFSISYIKRGNQQKILAGEIPTEGREGGGGPYLTGIVAAIGIPKTVWRRTRHDAGKWGSRTLRELLGSVSFDYSKSPYAVLDTLRTLVGDDPDAVVLDYFAGSGTTLHSVAMLNAEDGGSRRCILVTNNQVDEAAAKLLNDEGYHIGDAEYEAQGINRAVTAPRVRAALTGQRNGTALKGQYQGGGMLSDGFKENATFFDIAYEDPDAIEIGERFEDIVPALWLAAGAFGDPSSIKFDDTWLVDPSVPFAVLVDEDRLREFTEVTNERDDLTHVWLVTDSTHAFARMRGSLPQRLTVGMLYRDYLRNFKINAEAAP